jgi:large subunit ribosomal protein L17
MRHGNFGRKLGRSKSHRKALMRNLATALFTHGRICTTEMKAKELAMVADSMITLAKRGDLHAQRQAVSMVYDPAVVSRLFKEIAPWYKSRQGGYTRILKLEPRPGDNAPMAFIELVDRKPLGEIKVPVAPKKKFKQAKKEKQPQAKAAEPKAKPEAKAAKPTKAAKPAEPKEAKAKPAKPAKAAKKAPKSDKK